jgi:hypothetical protein
LVNEGRKLLRKEKPDYTRGRKTKGSSVAHSIISTVEKVIFELVSTVSWVPLDIY